MSAVHLVGLEPGRVELIFWQQQAAHSPFSSPYCLACKLRRRKGEAATIKANALGPRLQASRPPISAQPRRQQANAPILLLMVFWSRLVQLCTH